MLIDRSIFIRKRLNYSTSSLSLRNSSPSQPSFPSPPFFRCPGKFNNSETLVRYKSQRYLSRCRPPFPSAFLSAMAIIRKTFEGTKVRTFVPSFSSSSHSSFVRALCLRSDAPTVFCSLCLFFLLGIQCRNCLDHLFAYLLRVQPRKIPSFSPFLPLPSRSSLILDLSFSVLFFFHFIISLSSSG